MRTFLQSIKKNLQSIDGVHNVHVKCGCVMQSFLFQWNIVVKVVVLHILFGAAHESDNIAAKS